MSDIDNGGQAFPFGQTDSQSGQLVNGWGSEGMTLRDYFAAKAMQAMITTTNGPCLNGLDGYEGYTARAAYRIADAMLEARKQ